VTCLPGELHVDGVGTREISVSDDYREVILRSGTSSVDRLEPLEAMELGVKLHAYGKAALRKSREIQAAASGPRANLPPSDSDVGSPQ